MNLDGIIEPRKLREFRDLGDDTDDFLLDILDRYLKKSAEQLEEARRAFAAGDEQTLEDVVHSWKGATTALGLTELSHRLTELNTRLKDGREDDAHRRLDDLEESLEKLRQSREGESGT